MFVNKLEQTPRVDAFPYPSSFSIKDEIEHPFSESFFIGLDIGSDGTNTIDLSYAIKFYKRKVLEDPRTEHLRKDGMGMDVVHVRNTKLPEYVFTDERRPQKKKKKKKHKRKATEQEERKMHKKFMWNEVLDL